MTAVEMSDVDEGVRWIGQSGIPFHTPLGVPIVNPFAEKQMQFLKRYRVTGVTLDEASTGVLFGNYRPFMDVKEETYSRSRRTRHLTFNPFTREMEKYGGYAGRVGVMLGQSTAFMMQAALGTITWDIREEPGSPADVASFEYKTTSRFFRGVFRIRAKAAPDGVVLEDDWTTDGGSDMRTSFLPMANLVLMTHPLGFEQIADEFVQEVRRARGLNVAYSGEIGAPSVELRD
ncbi:MAG: hypothetical protein A3H97_17640 [Acidobacteria bacterium RIFCSPLOWO2_02_FULL_65_29]|nr:MAG: hypothetical protein A3H97_17640 [Acidobacteria bacterium RIFCSPLOWO2_02_FULL_65_29]